MSTVPDGGDFRVTEATPGLIVEAAPREVGLAYDRVSTDSFLSHPTDNFLTHHNLNWPNPLACLT